MPLDPNIILSGQAPQFASPLDTAVKAMTLKQLALQNQVGQRDFDESQAVKDAFRKNVTTDASGNPSLNRQAALGDLARINPSKAIDYQKMFQSQDLEKLKADTEASKNLAWSVSDEPSYQAARMKAQQLGLPNSDKLPDTYMPGFVQNWQMHTLSGEEQLKNHMAEQSANEKKQEFSLRREDNQMKREQGAGQKQNQSMQQTMSLLESARGNPAVAQAEKDLYATDKAKSLANIYADPNKLNNSQVNLLVSEIGKIASGGVPSMHELDGLTPGTLTGSLARGWEKLSNSPTPANAGAFVKQYMDYANSLSSDAKKVIANKYGRVIDAKKRSLTDDDYKALRANYIDRFSTEPSATATPSATVQIRDPQGNIRAIPADQVDAAKAAGGKPL